MLPSVTQGWMVNMSMRRVEPVQAEESPYNRHDYGRYRGPKRTYMLHCYEVHDSELLALANLQQRMGKRYAKLVTQLNKYRTELAAVDGAINRQLR